MENFQLIDAINTLKKKSRETDQAVWKAIAEELDKAKRRRVVVNMSRINRHAQEDEIAAIPGKVLGSGMLDHPVTVAAFQFSDMAKKKIELAQGRTMTLRELAEKDPDVSKIRIMK
jgi:large subunit ribosomal protein L18e